MDPHQTALLDAAHRLGVDIVSIDDPPNGSDTVIYAYGGRRAVVREGRGYPGLMPHIDALCADKQAAKTLFLHCGLATPRSLVVETIWDERILAEQVRTFIAASASGTRFVCKPVRGTNGENVFVDLPEPDAVLAHVRNPVADGPWLLENHASGADLRLQVIGRRLVAACVREPASVTGDGRSTLAELIASRDAFVRRQNPQNRLLVDEDLRQLLNQSGRALNDRPAGGERVVLKRVANMSQGATAVDVTDDLHPGYGGWVGLIADALNLETFALDIITRDPTLHPDESGAMALELNARAQWLHHTFSERRRHDIPAMILDWLLGPGLLS